MFEFTDQKEHVEDLIIEGVCEACDHDPTDCYNKGYCEYEKQNEKENRNGKKFQ